MPYQKYQRNIKNQKKESQKPSLPIPKSKESVRFLVVRALLEFEKRKVWESEPPEQISDFRNRKLYTQLLFGVMRHHRLLETEIQKRLNAKSKKLLRSTSGLLKLAFFELIFMDQIPEHATIHETVALTSRFRIQHTKALINAVLRHLQRDLKEGYDVQKHHTLAIRTSHPDWMIDRWTKRYGEALTVSICEQNNLFSGITLKAVMQTTSATDSSSSLLNLVESDDLAADLQPLIPEKKASSALLLKSLESDGLNADLHPLVSDAVVIKNSASLWKSNAYLEGECYVQDASSQLFVQWLKPILKGKVLDLCAAPGGKALEIAVQPEVTQLTVNDFSEKRMQKLRDNFQRLNLDLPEISIADGSALAFEPETFDVVLVDAPCSSTGTIRKNPDIKTIDSVENLLQLNFLQKKLLHESAKLIVEGGYLVYSTCSLEPEENENQILRFLSSHSEFDLVPWENVTSEITKFPEWFSSEGWFQMVPDQYLMGFFAAILKKMEKNS